MNLFACFEIVRNMKTIFLLLGPLDVRCNYKKKFTKKSNDPQTNEEALLCELCKQHEDSAENIFKCKALQISVNNINNCKFDDLFSKDMKKVSNAIQYFSKLWKIRQQNMK